MPVSSIVWSSKNWKFPIPEKPIYFTFPTSTIKIFFKKKKKKKKNLQQSKKDNPPSIISTFFFFNKKYYVTFNGSIVNGYYTNKRRYSKHI